jgi:hypothetical protein
MSFGAGDILGFLKFDISEFREGFEHVGEVAERFPEMVANLLDHPLQGFGAALHEGTGALAGALGPAGAFIGAAAGIASVLAAAAAEAIHLANEIAEATVQTSHLAERSGVSVEFFSSWSAAAKHAGVDQQTFANGLKFLQRSVQDALDGNKQTEKSFTDLGISSQFLTENVGNVEAIFVRVREALAALPTQTQRTREEMKLLGRGGSELTTLFNIPQDKIDDYIAAAKKAGVVESEEEVKRAKVYNDMRIDVEDSFEGMRKAIAKPVMDKLIEEWPEMQKGVGKLSASLQDVLIPLLKGVIDLFKILTPILQAAADAFKIIDSAVAGVAEFLGFNGNIGNNISPLSQRSLDFQNKEGDFKVETKVEAMNFHADKAADKIAEQLKPHVQKGLRDLQSKLQQATNRKKMASALGGK